MIARHHSGTARAGSALSSATVTRGRDESPDLDEIYAPAKRPVAGSAITKKGPVRPSPSEAYAPDDLYNATPPPQRHSTITRSRPSASLFSVNSTAPSSLEIMKARPRNQL